MPTRRWDTTGCPPDCGGSPRRSCLGSTRIPIKWTAKCSAVSTKSLARASRTVLQQIYDAFFNKEYVYLERRRGQEKFDITNGRHRIRIALDLGSDAIPARVKDLRS